MGGIGPNAITDDDDDKLDDSLANAANAEAKQKIKASMLLHLDHIDGRKDRKEL
mgnify:CR=1 FL=1